MPCATDFTTIDYIITDMILCYFNPHCKLNMPYNVPKAQFFRPEESEDESIVLSEGCEGYFICSDDENSSNSCQLCFVCHTIVKELHGTNQITKLIFHLPC